MGLISDGTTIFDAGALSAGLGFSMTFIKNKILIFTIIYKYFHLSRLNKNILLEFTKFPQ